MKRSAMVDSVIAGNTAGNPYSVAPNCTGPLFTNGANSYQWPGPTADVNDAGCGAVNVINPTVSSTKTLCQTSAGVASAHPIASTSRPRHAGSAPASVNRHREGSEALR